MKIDAFITTFEDNKLFDVVYYHTPERWKAVSLDGIDFVNDNWSHEIKFLSENGVDISQDIKNIPTNQGGIYFFFIKGILIPNFETYLAYIGRAQYTENQNLRKRCCSYYYEYFKLNSRPKISRMIEKWGKHLYLRYYPSVDNEFIRKVEAKLINGILPPFNDEIPEMKVNKPEPAF